MEISGERVVLRPVRDHDVAELTRMFAEPAVSQWWDDFDGTRVHREFLDEDDEDTSVYVIDVDGAVAGLIQCSEEPDAKYRAAGIDIALASAWHGTGIAVDAIRTLARDLIERRGHHHLTIDPAAANGRAIACYTKVGFRPVGILRRNEKGANGLFHDTLLMDLLAEELT